MTVRSLAAAAFAACLAMSCAHAGTVQAPAPGQPDGALLATPDFAPTRLFAPAPQSNSTVETVEMQRLKALRAAASPQRLADRVAAARRERAQP